MVFLLPKGVQQIIHILSDGFVFRGVRRHQHVAQLPSFSPFRQYFHRHFVRTGRERIVVLALKVARLERPDVRIGFYHGYVGTRHAALAIGVVSYAGTAAKVRKKGKTCQVFCVTNT